MGAALDELCTLCVDRLSTVGATDESSANFAQQRAQRVVACKFSILRMMLHSPYANLVKGTRGDCGDAEG